MGTGLAALLIGDSYHGDRSGGLLVGYIGLITVPVAFITYWKINNSTTGNSRYEQKSFNAGFSSNNAEMCRMGIDAYYASK